MTHAHLIATLPVANILGEGVQWNPRDGAFWWTDIQSRRLYRHHLASGETRVFETPERLCAFAFIDGRDGMMAAFETGFALYDPETGALDWRHRPESGDTGRRFNDGRTDRQGRFWVGTLVEDAAKAGGGSTAALYRLDRDGSLERMVEDVAISNGLCWSPDSSLLYFADSPTQKIRVFDFNAAAGTLANPRLFAEMAPGNYPDGAIIDAEGHMWTAQWGGSRVLRYRPDGTLAYELTLPVEQPTCVAFGGPDMDILCVTSARDGLSEAALETQKEAGHTFLFKMDVQGLAEIPYQMY
ncbi:SMP-30/gluconolactonase/LRE family protein [Niveispirillum irakense]|uniref:SMP-30/gluconolactonase/LRE family protein n=1 Tax=Niveispirillum irakense TaxID=34011 RepID=UPI000405FC2F|nr:SMP-30/gluconolactonase/LRE family protein [Niveispirillum irakense]